MPKNEKKLQKVVFFRKKL